MAALRDGVTDIPAMVERIYVGLDPRLKPAAGLSVLAHLLLLLKQGKVAAEGNATLSGRYKLT